MGEVRALSLHPGQMLLQGELKPCVAVVESRKSIEQDKAGVLDREQATDGFVGIVRTVLLLQQQGET